MPRCLPWFSKNKNYVINKDPVKARRASSTDGVRVRRPSDYDKIINSPSPPIAKPSLPKKFQNLNNGNNLSSKAAVPVPIEHSTGINNVSTSTQIYEASDGLPKAQDFQIAPTEELSLKDHITSSQSDVIDQNDLINSDNENNKFISENEEIATSSTDKYETDEKIQEEIHEENITVATTEYPATNIEMDVFNKLSSQLSDSNTPKECDNAVEVETEHEGATDYTNEDFTHSDSPKFDTMQVNLEYEMISETNSHRPTIVELKMQDDASSFVSGDTDLPRGSEINSVIDDVIVNIDLDEEIPEISRRSGLRTENIDINRDIIKYDKNLEETMLINGALLKNDFLKNILTETTRKLIVDIMTPRDVHKDEIVIRQGELGDNMYVSELGHYQVIKDDVELYTFNKNDVFGEVAVIYNHKRQATVKALTNGKLWKIHRDDYYRVMVTSAKEQESEIMTFLKTVPSIQDAPQWNLQQAVGLFTLKTFTADTNIVTEGEEGNEFFIIRAGIAKVTKKSATLGKLSRGQFFGEHALLNNDNKRQATVIAESPVVECLVLSVAYFKDLFGDLAQFMKVPTFAEAIEPVINNEYSNVQLKTLKLRTTLGVGGFGRVELAHLIRDDTKTFALKYLKRKRIIENEQIEHVFNEKRIQLQCSSPFIVQLYKTYNDKKYLYLLLELCLGGDIINLLQRQRLHCCKEEDTKFLASCVLEALSYLHDRNFVFRDLKPENMMLDHKGYVKLTDFGFAKKLERGERTYTFAGTPEYVAPEIIYQRGHDRAVDYWAFGIFIFELLVGKTPFKTADPSYMQTYNLIVRGIENVIFPAKIKNTASSLIKKLCNATPSERIGYKRHGIQEIRDHKWFQGFNWEKLQSCRMQSPFIPRLANHLDTKYFDKQRPDRDIPDDDFTAILNKF